MTYQKKAKGFTLITVLMLITILLLISGGIVYANLKQKTIGSTATALLDKNLILDAAVLETVTWLQDKSGFLADMVRESNRGILYFQQTLPQIGENDPLTDITTRIKDAETGGKSFIITFNDPTEALGVTFFPAILEDPDGNKISPTNNFREYLLAKLSDIYGSKVTADIKVRITLIDISEGMEINPPSFRIDAFYGKSPNPGSRVIGLVSGKPVSEVHWNNSLDSSGFYGEQSIVFDSFSTHESRPFKYVPATKTWKRTAKATNAFFSSQVFIDITHRRTVIHGNAFVNQTNANVGEGIKFASKISKFKNQPVCQGAGCHNRQLSDLKVPLLLPDNSLDPLVAGSLLTKNWSNGGSLGAAPKESPCDLPTETSRNINTVVTAGSNTILEPGKCYSRVTFSGNSTAESLTFTASDQAYYIKEFGQAVGDSGKNINYVYPNGSENKSIVIYTEKLKSFAGKNLLTERLIIDSRAPYQLKLVYTGTDPINSGGNTQGLYMHLYAPNAEVKITGTNLFHGNIAAKELKTGLLMTLISDELPIGAKNDAGRSPQVDLQFFMDRLQQVLR